MIQGNGNKKVINLTTSHHGQQQRRGQWWAHHSVDVSDASLAEFERLMASRGFRTSESSSIANLGDALLKCKVG